LETALENTVCDMMYSAGLNLAGILYDCGIPVLVRTAVRCTAPWSQQQKT